MPPSLEIIRKMANKILLLDNITIGVGTHWASRFIIRHQLKTGRSRPADLTRLTSLTFSMIDQLFDTFLTIVERYGILPGDIWNMDEKGFQMGRYGRSIVVFDKTQGPPASVSTGTSNWVSIIECINSTGQAINLYVIHMGKWVQSN